MSSAQKEIAEEVESLVPVEHVDSLKEASSSRQQDDSQRQETTLSADPEGSRQPEEEMANGKRTAGFVFLFRHGDDGCVLPQMTTTRSPAKGKSGFLSLLLSGRWRARHGEHLLMLCMVP